MTWTIPGLTSRVPSGLHVHECAMPPCPSSKARYHLRHLFIFTMLTKYSTVIHTK